MFCLNQHFPDSVESRKIQLYLWIRNILVIWCRTPYGNELSTPKTENPLGLVLFRTINIRPDMWVVGAMRWRKSLQLVLLLESLVLLLILYILPTCYLRYSTTQGSKTAHLKWQCHEIFDHFFLLKRFDLGPIWTGKNGFANFFVFAKIFAKNVCPRSQQIRWHRFSIFNDYADIVSA